MRAPARTGSDPGRWVVVAGPTASGKSALGMELAERLDGEIINADSRQVFRHLDVGTAKPSAAERARLPHHLYDVVEPDEPFDAARYARAARAAVADVAGRDRLPVVVGGTGLYLRALARGLFRSPPAHDALRETLRRMESASPGRLHAWLARLDPPAARRLHPNDRVRLERAIEFVLLSGERLSIRQAEHGFADRFGDPLWLVLDPDPEWLDRRIHERSRQMFDEGLVDELRAVLGRGFAPDLRPLRSIGYLQASRVLAGEWTQERAIEDLDRATRQLARRQRIWFRTEREGRRVDPLADIDRLLDEVARFVGGV